MFKNADKYKKTTHSVKVCVVFFLVEPGGVGPDVSVLIYL